MINISEILGKKNLKICLEHMEKKSYNKKDFNDFKDYSSSIILNNPKP